MYRGGMTVTALIIFFCAIVLATKDIWFPAGILAVFAVFGLWLATRYGRSGRWGR